MKRGVDAIVDIDLACWADITNMSALDIAKCPGFANSAILKVVMMVSRGTVVSEGGS